jgi:hypothetical protein
MFRAENLLVEPLFGEPPLKVAPLEFLFVGHD